MTIPVTERPANGLGGGVSALSTGRSAPRPANGNRPSTGFPGPADATGTELCRADDDEHADLDAAVNVLSVVGLVCAALSLGLCLLMLEGCASRPAYLDDWRTAARWYCLGDTAASASPFAPQGGELEACQHLVRGGNDAP